MTAETAVLSPDTAVLVCTVASSAATVLMMRTPPSDRAHRLYAERQRKNFRLSPTHIVQLCSVVAGFILIGGMVGIIAGIGAAAVAPTAMNRLERRADLERRNLLRQQLPLACDLLAVAMVAGRPPQTAIAEIAVAMPDPAAAQLATVSDRMLLAADSTDAWDGIDPELGEIGRAIQRSERSGTPVATVLSRTADERRRDLRAQIQHRIQRISVRTAAPLGLCFLPAFFLIGICPVLIGSVTEILP